MQVQNILSQDTSYSQLDIRVIENMDAETKRKSIKQLSPIQRRNLSPQLIEFFYKGFPKEEIKINPHHLTKTLEAIPALPEIKTNVKLDELMDLFKELCANHEELILEIAAKDSEVKNINRFEHGLLELIKTANSLEKPSITASASTSSTSILNCDSSEEEESDSEDHDFDAVALKTLIVNIVHLIKESNLEPIQKMEYLRDMAAGGLHCDRGQFTQTYKVYMKLIKYDTPEKAVLKFLHDIRDNIVDFIATQAPDDSSETVEIKSELIELFGTEIGLLTPQALQREKKETFDYSKLRDMNYVRFLINQWEKSGMDQNMIDFMLKDLKKQADKRDIFLNQFYSLYTSESIIKLLSQQSKEWDLYRWFLDHPKEEFKNDPNAQSEYVLSQVVDSSLFVKEEYIMQMLDEIGVLNF